jgi:hypothetical protein
MSNPILRQKKLGEGFGPSPVRLLCAFGTGEFTYPLDEPFLVLATRNQN